MTVSGEMFSSDNFKELLAQLKLLMGKMSSSYDNEELFLLDRCRKELDDIVRMMLAIPRSTFAEASLPPIGLVSDLIDCLVTLLSKINGVISVVDRGSAGKTFSVNRDTSGRPSFQISIDIIEQLRETGMSWSSMANFLGVSSKTLYRRRVELGLTDGYTEITDEDVFKEIEQVLSLTPYSGECYVKGSLQGKGIKVQRAIVRECLKRLDSLGREVRRRYSLVRRTHNVPG